MDSRHDSASDDRTPPRGDPRSAASLGLLAVGLLLVGLNLRIGVASVGPVLVDIRASLGLSAAGASLLTAIPVVAFGAFAFLTPSLTRRFGLHRLLGLALLVLVAGILLRSLPGVGMLFVGTVLIGAAIGVGNVVMPPAIKKDFARWAGLMMGLYSTALFVGAALASGLTVPMLAAVGRDWRAALAIWAIPAVLAHEQRTYRSRERSPRAPAWPGPRLPQPHQLHRPRTPRSRRIQTTPTPRIVKSPQRAHPPEPPQAGQSGFLTRPDSWSQRSKSLSQTR